MKYHNPGYPLIVCLRQKNIAGHLLLIKKNSGGMSLASTHPHHKHIPPDIKHHRIPAPNLSFTIPNLPFLIEEIISEMLS